MLDSGGFLCGCSTIRKDERFGASREPLSHFRVQRFLGGGHTWESLAIFQDARPTETSLVVLVACTQHESHAAGIPTEETVKHDRL